MASMSVKSRVGQYVPMVNGKSGHISVIRTKEYEMPVNLIKWTSPNKPYKAPKWAQTWKKGA